MLTTARRSSCGRPLVATITLTLGQAFPGENPVTGLTSDPPARAGGARAGRPGRDCDRRGTPAGGGAFPAPSPEQACSYAGLGSAADAAAGLGTPTPRSRAGR